MVAQENLPLGPSLGELYVDPNLKVPTSEWRYVLDVNGKKTGAIKRAKGRTVGDIAVGLSKGIKGLNFEWDTLGQPYKYRVGEGAGPLTECPDHDGIAVYVTHGGSEGHLVHVDLMIGIEGQPHKVHKKLFMVKTFAGAAYATRIAHRVMRLMGVL